MKIKIFFDGTCGLCHKFVRFVLLTMRPGIIKFSPQQGKAFKSLFSANKSFGQSIIVYNEQTQKIYFKGEAVIVVFRSLKWPWKGIAFILSCLPRILVDLFYDRIARVRHKIFKKPDQVCPLLPAKWTPYFDKE